MILRRIRLTEKKILTRDIYGAAHSTIGKATALVAFGAWVGDGAIFVLALESRRPSFVCTDPTYHASLLYLAVFASLIGFTTYLALVSQIALAQAVYAAVDFPVLALVNSSFSEGCEWTATAVVGVTLFALANAVMFRKFGRKRDEKIHSLHSGLVLERQRTPVTGILNA